MLILHHTEGPVRVRLMLTGTCRKPLGIQSRTTFSRFEIARLHKHSPEYWELWLFPYSCDTCTKTSLSQCETVTCSLGMLCAMAQSTWIISHLTHFHIRKHSDARGRRCGSSTFRSEEYAGERRLNGERTLDLCRLCFMQMLCSIRPLFRAFFKCKGNINLADSVGPCLCHQMGQNNCTQ